MKPNDGILYALCQKIVLIAGAGMTVIFIPVFLSPAEQGFYFTFVSLIASQTLFELGIGFVITQFIAHRSVELTAKELLVKDQAILYIYNYSLKWFRRASFFYVLAMLFLGYFFFNFDSEGLEAQAGIPWIMLVLASGLAFATQPYLLLCEGIGEVVYVAKLRFLQAVIGNLLLFATLWAGGGLYCLFLPHVVSLIINRLAYRPLKESKDNEIQKDFSEISSDIFKMQWRIALSWASGYLVFQSIIPVVFKLQNPIIAGKIGLALAIFNGIQSVATALLSVRVVYFSRMISNKNYSLFLSSFDTSKAISIFLSILGVALVSIAYFLGSLKFPEFINRIPAFGEIYPLALNCVLNVMIFSYAIFLRVHKFEPLLLSSVCTSLFSIAAVVMSSSISLIAICWSYTLVTVLIATPWTYLIYRKYRGQFVRTNYSDSHIQ